MRYQKIWDDFNVQYNTKIKVIKKGIFWIVLNEEAFMLSKLFNLKLTKLDSSNIKAGFPLKSTDTWIERFKSQNIGLVFLEKDLEGNYKVSRISDGNYSGKTYTFNIEDYELTKERILGLGMIGLEEKKDSDFLLKNRLEKLYFLLSKWLLTMPKRERHYFRQKIETLYMDLMEDIYIFMYNLEDRGETINKAFSKTMVLREYCRFLYNFGLKKRDVMFLDLGDSWVEILKIMKTMKNKYNPK